MMYETSQPRPFKGVSDEWKPNEKVAEEAGMHVRDA